MHWQEYFTFVAEAVVLTLCLIVALVAFVALYLYSSALVGRRLREAAERRELERRLAVEMEFAVEDPDQPGAFRIPGGPSDVMRDDAGDEFYIARDGRKLYVPKIPQWTDMPKDALPVAQDPPSIEETTALNAAALDENGDESFTTASMERKILAVVEFGAMMRRCDACQAEHTQSHITEYYAVQREGAREGQMDVLVEVEEVCQGCGQESRQRMSPLAYAAAEAASVMAAADIAREGLLLRIERGEDHFDD